MIFFKSLYKKTIVNIPGYYKLCLILRKYSQINISIFGRIPIPNNLIIPVYHNEFCIFLSRPGRCSIAKKYFWTSGFRHPKEDDITLNLFCILSKNSTLILDIGSNSGIFSLFAAKINSNAKIYSFDILLESIHIFYDNIYLNKLEKQISVNLLGIGSAGTILSPFDCYSSELPTAFSRNTKLFKKNLIDVNFITLDSFIFSKFINEIVLIKIDVEGTENDIFENSHLTLKLIRPLIICEVLTIGKNIANYDEILTSYSYDKYLISDQGLIFKEQIIPSTQFKDWLFIPSEFDISIINNENLLTKI
jgi:FkbM family methyltransferase